MHHTVRAYRILRPIIGHRLAFAISENLLVLLVIAASFLAAGLLGMVPVKRGGPPDCHIEWDGRSNPTVCD